MKPIPLQILKYAKTVKEFTPTQAANALHKRYQYVEAIMRQMAKKHIFKTRKEGRVRKYSLCISYEKAVVMLVDD